MEMEFKKLVTVTKSKFYMLKINYPQYFEEISKGDFDNEDVVQKIEHQLYS